MGFVMMKKILSIILVCITMVSCKPVKDKDIECSLNLISKIYPHSTYVDIEGGAYYLDNDFGYGDDFTNAYLIKYIDTNSMSMVPICSNISCDHTDEMCNAYIPALCGGYAIAAADEKIYIFLDGNSIDILPQIIAVDSSGSNPEVLITFNANQTISTPCYKYGDDILVKLETVEKVDNNVLVRNEIIMLDIHTGEYKSIYTAQYDEYITIVGQDNNNLVISVNNASLSKIGEEIIPTEAYLIYIDVENLNCTQKLVYDSAIENFYYAGKSIININMDDKMAYQINNGIKVKEIEIPLNLSTNVSAYYCGYYDDIAVFDFIISTMDKDRVVPINSRIAFDFERKQIYEIALVQEQSNKPVVILGKLSEGFMIKCADVFTDKIILGQDGVQRLEKVSREKFAYISQNDFLNNVNNYLEIQK